MIHASTSEPSGEIARNRSGAQTSWASANAAPTSVSRRSSAWSSESAVGVVSECTTRPAAASYPVTRASLARSAAASEPPIRPRPMTAKSGSLTSTARQPRRSAEDRA